MISNSFDLIRKDRSSSIAIYEVIAIDEDLSLRIKSKELEIKDLLKQRQIKSLADNAYALFLKGETSFEEINPILQ